MPTIQPVYNNKECLVVQFQPEKGSSRSKNFFHANLYRNTYASTYMIESKIEGQAMYISINPHNQNTYSIRRGKKREMGWRWGGEGESKGKKV